jgi:curli production assembly/transport component CsgE
MTGSLMNVKNFTLLTAVCMVCVLPDLSPGQNQDSGESGEIYIRQSREELDEPDLTAARIVYNESLIMGSNDNRVISLYFTDQERLIDRLSAMPLQWGFIELNDAGEMQNNWSVIENLDTDSAAGDSDSRSGALAEMLGNLLGGRDSNPAETVSDEDAMDAFRRAFEAVVEEDKARARAEQQEGVSDTGAETVELPRVYSDVEGIVLDETRSKTGRDFYNAFYDAWSKLEGRENSVVRIAEKPGPGMGSVVFVEVDYEEIFELRLRPGDQRTKQAGRVAAARTLQYLKEKPNYPSIY